MNVLTVPEPRAEARDEPSTGLIADEAKTGGMPMTTPLPALWTESPLLLNEKTAIC